MIELTILFAALIVLGSAIARIMDWRQDILHGPFLARHDVPRQVRERYTKRR